MVCGGTGSFHHFLLEVMQKSWDNWLTSYGSDMCQRAKARGRWRFIQLMASTHRSGISPCDLDPWQVRRKTHPAETWCGRKKKTPGTWSLRPKQLFDKMCCGWVGKGVSLSKKPGKKKTLEYPRCWWTERKKTLWNTLNKKVSDETFW